MRVYKLTLAVVILIFAWLFIERVQADTIKIGEGPFVLAVSYTDSYDDLEYVANFMSCAEAEEFYYSDNSFSSFDFEVSAQQSCGFVKTQEGYSTFIGED